MNAPHTPAGLDALRFGSGHTVRRIEDPTLVAGQGRYTDDLQREGLAHLVFVRSPHAHARLLSVDAAEARGWRITQVWNTHWHPDHVGGNAAIVAATGARVIGRLVKRTDSAVLIPGISDGVIAD